MLVVNQLRKMFGPMVAVDNISFTLSPGDVFAFIGSNGAGKTSTIRMLATLSEPVSGSATLNGFDTVNDAMKVRGLIGYMPDFFGLYDDIKVWEYLDFFCGLYDLPKSTRPGVIDSVLELTDLTIKKDAFVQTLSRGMQQRLCIARCLVHDPAMLLLDEPASGLDPRARSELKELILELGRMGKIVIVSSHILPELAGFCNKVGIIERGKMLACGPVDEIVRNLRSTRHIRIRMASDPSKALAQIQGVEGATDVLVDTRGHLIFKYAGDDDGQTGILRKLLESGHPVLEFQEDTADLEDVFMTLTTGAVS